MDLGRHKWRLGGVAVAAVIALTAAGCGSSSSPGASGGARMKGGEVTWAELPSTYANFIFPFTPLAYFSVSNQQDFQYLMYRPLYWYGGENVSPTVDPGLSPADLPVYTNGGTTVTINLKGWHWSNGESVDSYDVIFWLHMMEAELSNYGGAVPGGIPQNISSMAATGPLQVTLHLTKAYSKLWYTYNELSQISPMPEAWDVTSMGAKPGSGGCEASTAATHYKACVAVYNFLLAQAKDTGSYVTSPIWTVIDGPMKLSSFNTAGNVTFVPNPKYSGSPKVTISAFKEVPFTSDSSEYTALQSGSVDIGYIPPQDLPLRTPTSTSELPPTNPLASDGYTLAANYDWGFAYYLINYTNKAMGPVFKQLYARQALEYVDDQNGISRAIYRGYGYPNTGPAPAQPASNPWLSSVQKENGGDGPYPYSPTKAAALLTAHGWKEVGGVMTCQSGAKCGTGIATGTKFQFTLDYSTGQAFFTDEAEIYKSDASQAGISVNIIGQTFNTIIGEDLPTNPTWQGGMYGLWIYSPDYEPTGEELFATGAGSNSGAYSNPTMDKLIQDTETNPSVTAYHNFANYAAEQLPFIYLPLTYPIQAVKSNLHGVDWNPIQSVLPEYYYFTK
jgi:peptide/nickel transport system substrate-binding protein